MGIRFLPWVALTVTAVTAAQGQPFSTWMLDSILARQDGITSTGAMTRQIENGIFQEALRAAIERSDDATQRGRWTKYHHRSVEQDIQEALNASKDALDYGLDRLCLARSLLELPPNGQYDQQALQALRESIRLQPRNALGGLWYYANPPAPYNYYGDASYGDGMYGYAPYAALWGSITGDESLDLNTALQQLELIYRNARDPTTGLVKHGYQLSRNASWADFATGASPVIWGRSLAWYTVGLVDALELAATKSPAVVVTVTYHRIQALLRDIVVAEIEAVDKSASETGRYGIWQVVDQPGAPGNFIESSAGALITFALAKSLRLGYMGDMHGRVSVLVRKMHQDLVERFVGHNQQGMLDYFGTSAMASLHQPKVDYEYYVNLAVTTNSLIGTSAFVLASLEIERMG
ncbi:Six-hairpin glycosidase [Aspergillus campestris IBT 28561]|uniref:Six-hairpin glycosidase n=1 Tax=Aspergillus campestris (strain IBT 28561) TaxID=1392248 RepID=A0A2I1CQW8_ASPC2|nr:Six-hairpin glycosidase [Aspergillus campestris IBT 28561]PKY00021.1 Six-hairpin glycosidase [Aspergillus campestris IBT 28561]